MTRTDALVNRGKVKEVYARGDRLRFHFTDNVSVFDKIIPSRIPRKGEVLCRLSAYWLQETAHIVDNHFIALEGPADMVVRRFRILDRPTVADAGYLVPLEFIVRHYLAGSLHRRVEAGEVDPASVGIDGDVEFGMRLPEPYFEVTTKFEKVDRPVGTDEALRIAGMDADDLDRIGMAILNVDAFLGERARAAGLLHVDGKKEFALDADRNPVLVVSFGTPDEDRFWDLTAHGEGRFVDMSKEVVRAFYHGSGYYDELSRARKAGAPEPPIPPLPREKIDEMSALYADIFERLTGTAL